MISAIRIPSRQPLHGIYDRAENACSALELLARTGRDNVLFSAEKEDGRQSYRSSPNFDSWRQEQQCDNKAMSQARGGISQRTNSVMRGFPVDQAMFGCSRGGSRTER